jgi:5-methyltetrahydrofolate--homocysteine methyltransferase
MQEKEYQALADMILEGDDEGARARTEAFLAAGATATDILNKGLVPGMDVVGALFKKGERFIPEVLMSAHAMSAAMALLRPLLSKGEVAGAGVVVIGTVEGDIHNIGKELVAMMLEGAGFRVIDLGIDVKPATFVAAVREQGADIVAMSALLTTTMPQMQATVEALLEAGLREQVKVLAGGAPVSEAYVRAMGGDAYAPDAAVAVDKARALMAGRKAGGR